MRTFASYIEYLLMTQHYAFVPGVGGFMMKEVSSRIEPIEGDNLHGHQSYRLTPPSREVAFNPFMSYDDGMLVNVFMHLEHATFDEANHWLQQEAGCVLALLHMQKTYAIGKLGHLSMDEEGHILFIPSADRKDICDVSDFAFEPLSLRTLLAHNPAQPTDLASHDTINIPIRKSWLRYVAMIVIVICCFFGNFTTRDTHRSQSQYAAMIDHELLTGARRANVQVEHLWDDALETSGVDAELSLLSDAELAALPATIETAEAPAEAVVDATEAPTEAPVADATDPVALAAADVAAADAAKSANPDLKKTYYIVVASCNTMHEVEMRLERLKQQGYQNLGLIEKDNRFRLYIRDFEVKDDAMRYLDEIRKQDLFFDAWLLPARSNSIKLIIKTHINEQLSMELSHFTRRTETDQGKPDSRA